jgi:uncharacterized membrane-anchored protein
MTDITNPKLLWTKGALFLVLGTMASALLINEAPTLKVGALLAVAIWGFCRAYYFAFYVIERYADPSYRYSGLGSLVRSIFRNR